MIITEANISLSSEYQYALAKSKTRRLEIWVDQPKRDMLDLSEEGQKQCKKAKGKTKEPLRTKLPPHLQLLKSIIERLIGSTITVIDPSDLRELGEPAVEGDEGLPGPQTAPTEVSSRQGWGMRYEETEQIAEEQRLSFSGSGTVVTADGRTITLSLELFASKQYFAERNLTVLAGDAKIVDPLVINFSGLTTDLSAETFAFDLDSNGNLDNIRFVRPGSGFLALDKNGDGMVSDGSELFGPSTGSGFSELRAYDQDNNLWIDENDAIFGRLMVWTKDTTGADQLTSLKGLGIGALYLGSVDGQFKHSDASHALVGQTTDLGLFLKEDGTPGSIQQIDLAI